MPAVHSKYPVEFVNSVKYGNRVLVEEILKMGLDINTADSVWAVDSPSGTPLIHTAWRGDVKMVMLLLQYNADVNVCNETGKTALHYAAGSGRTEAVVALLQTSATNVNKGDNDGCTPLHCAAIKGHLPATVALIQGRADVDRVNNAGRTPLHFAAQNGHTDVVIILIQSDSDVNKCGPFGQTALHLAAQNGHTEAVVALIQGNADVNKSDGQDNTALHMAATVGAAEHVSDIFGGARSEASAAVPDAMDQDMTDATPTHPINGKREHTILVRTEPEHMKPSFNPIEYFSPDFDVPKGYKPAYVSVYASPDMSQIFVPSRITPGPNGLSTATGSSFRRVDDVNQHRTLDPGMFRHQAGMQSLMKAKPTERELNRLSAHIKQDWKELAHELGSTRTELEQIQMSYPHDDRRQILEMLVNWRERTSSAGGVDRCDILKQALIRIGKGDLLDGPLYTEIFCDH